MHHYFIMPFSKSLSIEVFAKKLAYGRSWSRFCQPLVDAGMSEEDAYHAFLYSDERMSHKFAAFEQIAFAQILKAVGDRTSWSLLIYMPVQVTLWISGAIWRGDRRSG